MDAALHIMGMTDEQTECDRCGRLELRCTVILADADGIEAGRPAKPAKLGPIWYSPSTCAMLGMSPVRDGGSPTSLDTLTGKGPLP